MFKLNFYNSFVVGVISILFFCLLDPVFNAPADIVAPQNTEITPRSKDSHDYIYWVRIESVYDGDTATLDFDLGRRIWILGEKVRLYGINAPEVTGKEKPKGLLAKAHLISLIKKHDLDNDGFIRVRSYKDLSGKFGRFLVVFIGDDDININMQMIKDGHAVEKFYGSKPDEYWIKSRKQ